MFKLVERINDITQVGRVPPKTLKVIFDASRPELLSSLIDLREESDLKTPSARKSLEDMLEEISKVTRKLISTGAKRHPVR
jgi:hypothetical protein